MMIQEYYSATGTGVSYSFIPNQIDTNKALGWECFYVIGFNDPLINQTNIFGKSKKVKLSDLHKKGKALNIKFLKLERNSEFNMGKVDVFLKAMGSKSNIIIDGVGSVISELSDLRLLKGYAASNVLLTLISQSTHEFYSLKED